MSTTNKTWMIRFGGYDNPKSEGAMVYFQQLLNLSGIKILKSAGWNWIKDRDEIVVDTTLLVNLQRHLTSLHIMKYEKNICNVTTGHMVSELANCSIFSLVLGHDSYIHRSNRWEVVFQSSNRKLYKLLSILQGIWRIICSNKGKIMWGKNSHVPKFHSRLQNIL